MWAVRPSSPASAAARSRRPLAFPFTMVKPSACCSLTQLAVRLMVEVVSAACCPFRSSSSERIAPMPRARAPGVLRVLGPLVVSVWTGGSQ